MSTQDAEAAFGNQDNVRDLVCAMQSAMNDIQPLNIEVLQAVAFVIGETLACGAKQASASESTVDMAIDMLAQLTRASAQLHAGMIPDALRAKGN